MAGRSKSKEQRMKALAKARAVATAKRKEAKRLGIPLSEVQLPPSAAELEFLAAQEKEKQVRKFESQIWQKKTLFTVCKFFAKVFFRKKMLNLNDKDKNDWNMKKQLN